MPNRRTVMILGGGTMQLPSIRLGRSRGWRVVVADANPEAEGRDLADGFIHVDLKDLEGLERAAYRVREDGGLDGVFTAGTDFSASVAWVAERLGLPGIPYKAALDATDKGRMRECFARQGVPHPRFAMLGAGESVEVVLRDLRFPLVVKPVDNMGARGVRRVDDEEQLRQAHVLALRQSRTARAIVEEYMEGPELSVDAVVHRGIVTICGVADRHIHFPPFFVELGHTLPADLDRATLARVLDTFRAGVRALSIDSGAAKGDIKLTPDGPKIGEIAARLSGGYMSGWTFPYASGVEVTEAGLRVAMGDPPGDLSPTRSWHSAERAFISLPGKVVEVLGLAEARSVPCVRNLFVRTTQGLREVTPGIVPDPSGIVAVFPTNNVEKCGNVITQAETREEAVARAREAIGRIFVRLAPDDARTTAFLFGGARTPQVMAFPLRGAGVREAIAAMPSSRGSPGGLSYLPLDLGEERASLDWHGMRADAALDLVGRITGVGPAGMGGSGLRLGRRFWDAFRVGGVQGAVYLVDSVRHRLDTGRDLGGLVEG